MSEIVIIITVIAAVALVAAISVVYFKFNSEEARDKRFRRKSHEIRSKFEGQVNDIRKNVKDKGINLEDTPEGIKLNNTLRECDYLIRDGYRSLDKIQNMSKELPKMEQAVIS